MRIIKRSLKIFNAVHLQDLHEPGDAGDPAVTPFRTWIEIFFPTQLLKGRVKVIFTVEPHQHFSFF